jgi:hypothetical protein
MYSEKSVVISKHFIQYQVYTKDAYCAIKSVKFNDEQNTFLHDSK